MKKDFFIYKITGIAVLILIWFALASGISDDIILPGPLKVAAVLKDITLSGLLFTELFVTLLRGLAGLSIAIASGIFIGILLGLFRPVYNTLSTIISFTQSTPVIAWILLALIWFPAERISIYIVTIATFPIIALSTAEGILNIDNKLLQMAQVFKFSRLKIIRFIYLPNITGYLSAALKIAIGLTLRAAVMAEVLSHPGNGVGEKMSWARINIETAEIIAWTIVIVIATLILDFVLNKIFSNIKVKKA